MKLYYDRVTQIIEVRVNMTRKDVAILIMTALVTFPTTDGEVRTVQVGKLNHPSES